MKGEIYRRSDGKWAWRVRSRNGQVIAVDGSQGYERRSACLRMLLKVTGGIVYREVDA